MSLAEQNAAHAQKIIAGVGPHIEGLAQVADYIKHPSIAKILRGQRVALAQDTFRLPVLGRFRNGKSTFLNAMLCELTHPVPELAKGTGPLPSLDLPTTAVLTTIDFDTKASVVAVKHNGKSEDWSLSRFQTEAIIDRDPAKNEEFYSVFREFKLRFPSKTLQSGITILDTPGTDDIRERTEIVEALLHQVDAAIVMFRSDALGGQDEREFVMSLLESRLTDLFFVVNRRSGRKVDEDLKSEAWYRIAELCLGKGRYAGQNLADHNIFFVDAKAALDARISGNQEQLAASGMDTFERQLSAYLEKNKRPAHVKRFVQGADAHAQSIDDAIAKMIPTFKVKAEEFRTRLQMLQPQLQDIRRRADKLPRIIASYSRRADDALALSFQDMINQLCSDLPAELAAKKIPSVDDITIAQRFALPFRKKKILQETEAAAKEIYTERLNAWSNNPATEAGAPKVMGAVVDEMVRELEDELTIIKRKFDSIQFDLVGVDSGLDAEAAQSTWVKNIMIGAVSIVWPDYAYGFVAGGWGGVLRTMLVHVVAYSAVVFFGGPVMWAVVAATFAGIVFNAIMAPEELKKVYRNQVCDAMIPKLREIPSLGREKMHKGVEDMFQKIQDAIKTTVEQEISKEEETINQQLQLATKSVEEKQTLLEALEHYRKEIKKCRAGLQDTLIAVQSGSL